MQDGEVIRTRPKSNIDEYLIFEGKHPAIIDDDLFYAAVERHGNNPKPPSNKDLRNPFAGLVYCSCGASMIMRTYSNKGEIKAAPRMLCPKQTKCGNGSCLYDELLERVTATLKECIADFEIRVSGDNKDAQKLHANLIKDLEKLLEELEAKEVNLWDKYTDEKMPQHIFNKLNAEVLQDKEKINVALCEAKKSMPAPVDYEKKLYMFKDALETLQDENASVGKKNALLKACIAKIKYSREKPQRIKRKPGEKKGTSLSVGGNWTTPHINLDIELRV